MDNSERAVIPQRQLGTSGVFCEGMTLGCYSMSNAYGTRSDSESIQVIRQAIEDANACGHAEAAPLALGERGQETCTALTPSSSNQQATVRLGIRHKF